MLLVKRIYQIFFSYNSKLSRIRTIIEDIAKTDISVLIKGESGTGKELIAEVIHFHSPRRGKPFIKVNCAAIPGDLLESELFGFERGAFTGATVKKPGRFELANDGTLLLNDIGEMDVFMQAKLLHVLQDGNVSYLGGDGHVTIDTRVIATTEDHLETSVKEGLFREDLFYRINGMTITVPPLRDRKEQIVPLSQYFFNLYRAKYGKILPSLSLRTLSAFKSYSWPGNIRELESAIKRIVLMGEEEEVWENLIRKGSADKIQCRTSDQFSGAVSGGGDELDLRRIARTAGESAEKRVIQKMLERTRWNRKDAATLLGISYKTLLNKIQRYRLHEL
jgi:two-component system response regulator AtoC